MSANQGLENPEGVQSGEGITRHDHLLEIPQRTYRHGGFAAGELTAVVDGDSVRLRVLTIEEDCSLRVPAKHLSVITDLLIHIRQDQ